MTRQPKKLPVLVNRCGECNKLRCDCPSRRRHTSSGELTDRAASHGYSVADRLTTGFWMLDMAEDDSISDGMESN